MIGLDLYSGFRDLVSRFFFSGVYYPGRSSSITLYKFKSRRTIGEKGKEPAAPKRLEARFPHHYSIFLIFWCFFLRCFIPLFDISVRQFKTQRLSLNQLVRDLNLI